MTIQKTVCNMTIIAALLVLLIQSDFFGGPAVKANHKIVFNRLTYIFARFEEQGVPIEEVGDFVATGEVRGNITPELVEHMNMVDVWGNRFRTRLLTSGKIGLYSLGRDKMSVTAGEDPDDISSWNGVGTTYLNEEASAQNKKLIGVAVSGFVLIAALCWRIFYKPTRRAVHRIGESERIGGLGQSEAQK